MKLHASITSERVIEAIKRGNNTTDNPGICVSCGEDQEGCEPDAERYKCETCGQMAVYGAEQLLLYIV
jgi:hypothetical protein